MKAPDRDDGYSSQGEQEDLHDREGILQHFYNIRSVDVLREKSPEKDFSPTNFLFGRKKKKKKEKIEKKTKPWEKFEIVRISHLNYL